MGLMHLLCDINGEYGLSEAGSRTEALLLFQEIYKVVVDT